MILTSYLGEFFLAATNFVFRCLKRSHTSKPTLNISAIVNVRLAITLKNLKITIVESASMNRKTKPLRTLSGLLNFSASCYGMFLAGQFLVYLNEVFVDCYYLKNG